MSDWFVNGAVAQSLDPWHPPGIHTSQTMHDGVDYYYKMGFLINFYAHGLSTGDRGQSPIRRRLATSFLITSNMERMPELHPLLWPVNARDVYQWWLNRSTVRVTANSYPTNGSDSVAVVSITGAQDTNTAIEILAVGSGSAFVSQLLTNGVLATRTTTERWAK